MKVIKKQTNSKMCYICGLENPFGLQAPFYETEDKKVVSLFRYRDIHQSYPLRVHGGLIGAMLDEIGGRAIWTEEPDIWGVTMDLIVKYRKPVPYDVPLKAEGCVNKNTHRIFTASSRIYDLKGNLLAEGEGKYFKLPLSEIASGSHDDVNVYLPDDVREIDV